MFIRTENLLLRPGWVDDAPALAAAIGHEEVVKTLASAPWPYTLDDAVAYLARKRTAHKIDLQIFYRDAPALPLIGGISLIACAGELELGYWIAPPYWGRGFATEAARAVVAAARDSLGLDRLVACCFRDNPASGRVLEKLGFTPTGAANRNCRAVGAARASTTYALTLRERVAA